MTVHKKNKFLPPEHLQLKKANISLDKVMISFDKLNNTGLFSQLHAVYKVFFFFTCGRSWTQVCSHKIGYIPVLIGLYLLCVAPTHITRSFISLTLLLTHTYF